MPATGPSFAYRYVPTGVRRGGYQPPAEGSCLSTNVPSLRAPIGHGVSHSATKRGRATVIEEHDRQSAALQPPRG